MTTDSAPQPARLEWRGADALPPEKATALLGEGAPFELGTEVFDGIERTVFKHAPRHLRAMFDATVKRQPDAPLIAAPERTWTFREAMADIERITALLQDRYGVKPGDRVAIVSANSPEYLLTMWGIISCGAIITSLNGWWTGPEITHGIALTEPVLLLGDQARLDRVEPGSVPDGVPIVLLTDLYEQAQSVDPGDGSRQVERQPNDPCVILFTSGTTGKAKGATIAHRNVIHFTWGNLLSGAIGAMLAGPPATPPSPPATLVVSPMFHISGLTASLMSGPGMGVKLVFPTPGRWDPTKHLQITHEHRISSWSGVPTQFWRLLGHPDFDQYDVTCVTSAGGGGAPFPPELVREFQRLMPQAVIGNGYGMSESFGMGTAARGPLILSHPESVGVANPTVEVEIHDPFGEALPEGEVGEIWMRSNSIFLGYWNNPEATAAVLDGEGWYHTGDFGRISDGRLYLESRMRDLIIRGGENIYPMEIEHRLVEHPKIRDSAVIGVDHKELGQEVKAVVVPVEGETLTVQEVQEWAAAALARFKVPAYVEFRDSLPYTESGKVQKHVLEAEDKASRAAG